MKKSLSLTLLRLKKIKVEERFLEGKPSPFIVFFFFCLLMYTVVRMFDKRKKGKKRVK